MKTDRLTVVISADLKKQFKQTCETINHDMNFVVEELITEFVGDPDYEFRKRTAAKHKTFSRASA